MKNKKIVNIAIMSFFAIVTSCREELISTNEATESKKLIQDGAVKSEN